MNNMDPNIMMKSYLTTFHNLSINRSDVINDIIKTNGYKTYLEIGVRLGHNFRKINCESKISVDPVQYGYTTYQMTSDDYFASLDESVKFDMIFIDGMHLSEFVYRDIMNAIKHLNPNGTIACHDMNPIFEILNFRDDKEAIQMLNLWNGDCWKGFVQARTELEGVDFSMIEDCDNGLGIIQFGNSGKLYLNKAISELTYNDFDEYKSLLMNPITLDDFYKDMRPKLNKTDNQIIICAIAKNEYNYILDWVKYHLQIGFDKIIIYDNNNVDGERYDELLYKYIIRGQVEIRDVRGLTGQQTKVYNECYNNDDFAWMAVIDLDEYIWFGEDSLYTNIKDYLASFTECDIVALNWKCYGDNGLLNNDFSMPVYERFTEPMDISHSHKQHIYPLNKWIKSIYRKGINIELNEHFVNDSRNSQYKAVNADKGPIELNGNAEYLNELYKICYIKHFISKSLEEWYNCKINRGHANVENGGGNQKFFETANVYGWHHGFDTYFNYNPMTEEKEKMLHKFGYDVRVVFRPTVLLTVFCNNQEEVDSFRPYYDRLQAISNLKAIFYIDDNEPNYNVEIPGIPYTEIIRSYMGYDLMNLHYLSFDSFSFNKDDINIHINIGSTLTNGINWNSVGKLLGNEDNIRSMMENVIKNDITYIDGDCSYETTGLINNCPGFEDVANDYCIRLNYPKISDYYIDGNCFMTAFDNTWNNVIKKTSPYQLYYNNDIIKCAAESNTMTPYQIYQCVYPNMFKSICKI